MKLRQVLAATFISVLVWGCADSSTSADSAMNDTSQALIAPAELVSLQEITIGPPNIRRMWQFKIEYLARENTLVKQGDLLVRFDGQRLKNDLISRQSDLDAALKEREKSIIRDEATEQDLILQVAEAKKNRDIAQRKVEITDSSQSEIERLKEIAEFEITTALLAQAEQKLAQHKQAAAVNLEVQNAKVANAEARVKEFEDSIAKLEIMAPADGMVTYIADWEDNKPAVGETVFMGRSLMNLPSLEQLAVKVEIDESLSAQIQPGQPVRIVLDDHPERAFTGRLVNLGKTYRNKSQWNLKVVVDAWVSLDEADLTIMRPGMKANVEFI
ncbi:HlyD family efflux transporter periplasmic adaptor subunit [Alteromonas sp. ASW11-36]|uniref:HlyD family efflux transporter periplasmic adaptor subunit n=1 Tax=Alteromonas arenosi TaxID=3055817 RepID=A0ABT7T191_9ALTE|nr:efflux RND transporter periplasmic adaptor subunit [Alteromonas sp. ASW11-36]MDM7862221.1 HlyD family efflux transporter periplasmic adaptor subunit [Alteromonas sp. ASW11-36]